MSNLGAYQWITTTAKKVGGPIQLLGLTFIAGGVCCKAIEFTCKKCVKYYRKHFTKKDVKRYSVMNNGISNEGLILKPGDEFDVLEIDGDVVLIAKVGDEDNPYYVSSSLLKAISNYNE